MNAFQILSHAAEVGSKIVKEKDNEIKKLKDRISQLEKEKIRAYDNGYEDGRKQNTEGNH